jgi:hypothetical protein
VKDQPWDWTPNHASSFEALKSALTTAPVLQAFHPEAQSILISDASKFAIGAALVQVIDGEQRQVAFYSRKLIAA